MRLSLGESRILCGLDRKPHRSESLVAPASLGGPGRTSREVCGSEYREAFIAGIVDGLIRSTRVGCFAGAALLVAYMVLRSA
jgi:hypothetical protein